MRKISIGQQFFNLLSEGDNHQVIVFGQSRVAKLFEFGDPQAKEELRLMQHANQVNGLLVTGYEIIPSEDYLYDLLVMERVTSLHSRSMQLSEREDMVRIARKQLQELHQNGFAHWDIKRPKHIQKGCVWDNVMATQKGIRLIDTGISVTAEHPEFQEAVEDDLNHFEEWAELFLRLAPGC